MPKHPEYPPGAGLQPEQAASLPGTRRANRRNETVYHVFTHGTDLWTGKRGKVEKTYRRFVIETGSARLYEKTYQDRENDVMISEQCIKAVGAYPG